jgi:hypothetical protein
LRFFLAHTDKLEVSPVFESDEDANSILCFELIRDEVGIIVCINEGFAVASPTRVLVFRPPLSAPPSPKKFVDVGDFVAIVFDVVGAEVVLEDIVWQIMSPSWSIMGSEVNSEVTREFRSAATTHSTHIFKPYSLR